MCLIINRPEPSVEIPESLLERALGQNPHGWGVMRAGRKGLVIDRGLKPAGFWNAFKAVGAAPCAIHFRFSTHGKIDTANCHPFVVCEGQYAVMHNGVIQVPIVDKDRSDTHHFAAYVLGPILEAHPGLFGSDYLESVLSSLVGPGNKLAIMRADGKCMIVNREAGEEYNGLWLSNGYSLPAASKSRGYFFDWAQDDRERITRRSGSSYAPPIEPDHCYAQCEDTPPLRLTDVRTLQDEDEDTESGPDVATEIRDLYDLAYYGQSEIAQLCYEDPDMVADLIWDAVR